MSPDERERLSDRERTERFLRHRRSVPPVGRVSPLDFGEVGAYIWALFFLALAGVTLWRECGGAG